jgi:hypothetical protein
MRMLLTLLLTGFMTAAAHAADPCIGKVATALLSYDRDTRQGAGLLLNYCGRPVQAELQVIALNRHGFPVSKMRTTIQTPDANSLSVVRVELPFVQSVMVLSGYTAEVAATTALDVAPADTADRGAHIARRP